MSPTISMVTPSLNQGQFLGRAIDSVLSQVDESIEYIVIDGGSTDSSLEVLKSYGPQLRWISEPDEGQADAILKGFARTTAPILGWLNSDDELAPGALEAVKEAFRSDPDCGLVYGAAERIRADNRPLAPYQYDENLSLKDLLTFGDFIVQPAAFFRRETFESVGGLDRGLHYAFDYDLWIRLAHAARIKRMNKVLARDRIHGATKTLTGGLPRLHEIEEVVRRHGGRRLPTEYRWEMSTALWGEGMSEFKRGSWRSGFPRFIGSVFYGWRRFPKKASAKLAYEIGRRAT